MAIIRDKKNRLFVTNYKKEYCEQLLSHMEKGYSFGSFAANLRVCPKTLDNWASKHEEFYQAKKTGHEAAKKHFESIALAKIRGQDLYNAKGEKIFEAKKADTALIIFFLKTRFKDEYTERTEIELNRSEINITYKEKPNEERRD